MSNRPGATYAGTITKKRSQATNTIKGIRAAPLRQSPKQTRRDRISRCAARLAVVALVAASVVETVIRAVH